MNALEAIKTEEIPAHVLTDKKGKAKEDPEQKRQRLIRAAAKAREARQMKIKEKAQEMVKSVYAHNDIHPPPSQDSGMEVQSREQVSRKKRRYESEEEEWANDVSTDSEVEQPKKVKVARRYSSKNESNITDNFMMDYMLKKKVKHHLKKALPHILSSLTHEHPLLPLHVKNSRRGIEDDEEEHEVDPFSTRHSSYTKSSHVSFSPSPSPSSSIPVLPTPASATPSPTPSSLSSSTTTPSHGVRASLPSTSCTSNGTGIFSNRSHVSRTHPLSSSTSWF